LTPIWRFSYKQSCHFFFVFVISGFTLWSENDLKGVNTTRNKGKSFSLIASDKLTDKFQELDASGSVQISVLLGMMEPKGSAVYLVRKKRHFRETSIHVRCHYLSAVKEFTMEQLEEEKIRFVGIARNGNQETATHVVTKIQYGADATFTLTKRFEKDEDEQKASDELNQCADKLIKALNGSAMMVDAAGNLSGSNDVIDCHFATDFNLPDDVNIPTTFEQAMGFTRTFKQFAYDWILAAADDETHQSLGVPVTIWLHPLVSMPGCDRTSPALLYDEMSLTLTSQCVRILGNYEKMADELHSMLQDPLARRLSPFFKKLELVQQHLVELKMKLRKKVVNIRSGETQQKDSFAQLLSEMESELLLGNSNGLKRWLGQKHQELCIVRRFEDQAKDKIRNSKKVHFFPSARTLREQMTKVPVEISFEISFSFLARSESFLESLNQKITEEKRNDSNQHGQHQLWYENKAVFERIEKEIVIFAEIVNTKSNDEKFAFAMTAPDEYDNICSTQLSIIVYNQQEKISGWNAVRNVCQHYPKERIIDLFRLLIEHYETRENLVDIIRLLVEPKIPEKWNPFPLLALIRYYQEDNLIDIVRLMLLIETNIDIHCKDNDGWNAFHTVCRYYRRNDLIYIFRLLIEKRIDVNCQTKFGNNALTLLCRHYRRNNLIDIVRLLIEKNIDVNCQTIDGWNALLLLCRYCKEDNLIDIVRLLIKNNINVNCKTSIGNGALNLLCQHYDKANLIDIVRLLIENCIDVNCKSQDGWNALLTVCRYYKQENLIDIVRLLIENNINVKCKSVYRCNALTLLCQHYHRENLIDIIQLLVIDEKVDVNCKDNDGWNALHYLCDTAPNTSGLADLVQLFIDHNINTNVMTGFWYGKLIANLFSSNYVRATASSLLMKRFNENEVRDVLRILDRNPRFLSKLINRFLISTL
jgi:ankyrin repeat protein